MFHGDVSAPILKATRPILVCGPHFGGNSRLYFVRDRQLGFRLSLRRAEVAAGRRRRDARIQMRRPALTIRLKCCRRHAHGRGAVEFSLLSSLLFISSCSFVAHKLGIGRSSLLHFFFFFTSFGAIFRSGDNERSTLWRDGTERQENERKRKTRRKNGSRMDFLEHDNAHE